MEEKFTGFPNEGLQFLADIRDNNNKAWFDANKPVYQAALLEPGQDFIEVVGEELLTIVPGIRYDTRTNGTGSLMRFYRDTRFSKDKTPYKIALAGMWWLGAGKKTQHPAFGFHMESMGMELMSGVFNLDKDKLRNFREAVAGPEGESLVTILSKLRNTGYQISQPTYKRVPKDFPKDHPRADLLLHKGLYVFPDTIPASVVTTAGLVDVVIRHFTAMAPVLRWLADAIN